MNRRITMLVGLLLAIALLPIEVLAVPQHSGAVIQPATGTQYTGTLNKIYGFQIKWVETGDDYNAIATSNVTFQNNFNGTTWNFTVLSNNTVGVFWVNFTLGVNVTGAGNFTYRWYARNNTAWTNENSTASTTYEIAQNVSVPVQMNLTYYDASGVLKNSTNAGATSHEGKGNPYVECWMGSRYNTNNPLWGTTSAYRDGVSITKGSGGAISLNKGSYTYKCNSTGNTNYTDNSTGISVTLGVVSAGGGGGGGISLPSIEVPAVTMPRVTVRRITAPGNVVTQITANLRQTIQNFVANLQGALSVRLPPSGQPTNIINVIMNWFRRR